MSASSRPMAVGIDLGTTYSVIARLDDLGRPVTLPNAEGDRLTPSVVLFEENEIVVGREALKALSLEANRCAECSKRDVGQSVFHKVFDGKQYAPEVIEAWVLNKLRADAEQIVGPVRKAVITVPAYFDEVRRKATQDAGYMAGLEVLDIINEPTAAALAFGLEQGFLTPEGSSREPHRVLVYDLGGGTFDVCCMEIRGTQFIALAIDGDVHLGGYDWDQRLANYVADEFERLCGVDPREDARSMGRLWRHCEEAKRTLTSRGKVLVPCEHRGRTLPIEVTREWFEEITADLVERTRFTTCETLKAVGWQWSDVERILLVGGATRMPMVRQMLEHVSGIAPDGSVAADEAVAHGAALHAGLILAKQEGQPAAFKIKNVNAHSLGVVGFDPQTQRRRTGVLIPRNTRLPVRSRRVFRTSKDDQRSILVEIVEGENPSPEECIRLGRCTVADLPPHLPAKTPVHVQFAYAANGRLKVEVKVPGAERKTEIEIVRETGLPKSHLDGWREYICGQPPTDYH